MDIFGNYENRIGKIKDDLAEYEHQADIEPKNVLEEKNIRPSFSFLYLLLIIVGLVLFGRLLDLQITHGVQFQGLAEGNSLRSRLNEAPRGIIYDQTGKPLVKNTASFCLELIPADLPRNKDEREKIYSLLRETQEVNFDEIVSRIEQEGLYSLAPITLKDDLERNEALLLKIKFAKVNGVHVTSQPNREYVAGAALSHILGYIGKVTQQDLDKYPDHHITDRLGKTGLEYTYDTYLKGQDGQEQVEVDAKGQIHRVVATVDSTPGDNLVLSLDLGLQKKISDELAKTITEKKTGNAVALALDPRDGGILAMVSLPDYDNNLFSEGITQEDYQALLDSSATPLVNRAIAGEYPPGSTIKPVIASAALNEGVINENTTVFSSGEIKIGSWVFPDWKAHGQVDVRKAIAVSCDVFFYTVGGGWDQINGLGVKKIEDYLKRFGFGKKTGVDLDGEQEGLVPNDAWKKKAKNEPWYIGDTYHLSIGQGYLTSTPLQLVNAISAVANGGELLKPHFVSKITDNQDKEIKKISKEVLNKDFVSKESIQIAREGMRQAVTSGTARILADLKDKSGQAVAVAGKTGTAQFGSEGKTHSWFVTFAPYDDPTIVLAVLVEGGGEGSETSLPIAKNILNYWFGR